MRKPLFDTRITRLLGIDHPLLFGGLGPGVSDARYVAAAVNAGCMGFVVAAGYDDTDQFLEELRLCRELTGGKPFGVNMRSLFVRFAFLQEDNVGNDLRSLLQ